MSRSRVNVVVVAAAVVLSAAITDAVMNEHRAVLPLLRWSLRLLPRPPRLAITSRFVPLVDPRAGRAGGSA